MAWVRLLIEGDGIIQNESSSDAMQCIKLYRMVNRFVGLGVDV